MNKNTQRLLNIAMSGYDRQREVQYRNNISSLSVPRDMLGIIYNQKVYCNVVPSQ